MARKKSAQRVVASEAAEGSKAVVSPSEAAAAVDPKRLQNAFRSHAVGIEAVERN
jgi:hypothetical protein